MLADWKDRKASKVTDGIDIGDGLRTGQPDWAQNGAYTKDFEDFQGME